MYMYIYTQYALFFFSEYCKGMCMKKAICFGEGEILKISKRNGILIYVRWKKMSGLNAQRKL